MWVQMDEPTYPGLIMEFYNNMFKSSLNPYMIIIELKGKGISVTPELLADLPSLLNSGIILREVSNDEKPHL